MTTEKDRLEEESMDILTFLINQKSDRTPLRFISESVYQDYVRLCAKEQKEEKARASTIQKIEPENG